MNVIAVDGPAGVGKSTVARGIAERLGYAFLSSGMVYRAVAWWLGERGWDGEAAPTAEALAALEAEGLRVDHDGHPMLRTVRITADLRSEAVSALASRVSAHPDVREVANRVLRAVVTDWIERGATPGVVLEGRDIGTVVFPDAPHKIFLTGRDEVRAERRYKELKPKEPDLRLEDVLAAMRERDRRDRTRAVAPLVAAPDAVEIDTSELNIAQVVEAALQHIRG